jgi:hypothetical protein
VEEARKLKIKQKMQEMRQMAQVRVTCCTSVPVPCSVASGDLLRLMRRQRCASYYSLYVLVGSNVLVKKCERFILRAASSRPQLCFEGVDH